MVPGPLVPTWTGHVATTRDALILFEACLKGDMHHVPRRPHDRERSQLIKSGSVFIYEENASGIKRWTDGVPWSPSRILGNFLVYRELTKPFPPGEKKRATKRSKRPTKPGEPYPRANAEAPASPTTPGARSENGISEGRDGERALIGSLIDSYGFKDDGLVKKTMSVTVNNIHHHLVSYYKIDEVLSGQMRTVSQDPSLHRHDPPRGELIHRQNFRAPLDGDDADPQEMDDQQNLYYAHQQQQQQFYPGAFITPGQSHPQMHPQSGGAYNFPQMFSAAEIHPQYPIASPPTTQAYQPSNQSSAHTPVNLNQPLFNQTSSYGPQYGSHPQSYALPSIPADQRSMSHQHPAHRLSAPGPVKNEANGYGQRDGATWPRPPPSGVYAPTATQTSPTNDSPSYPYSINPHHINGQQGGMQSHGPHQLRTQGSPGAWPDQTSAYSPMSARQPSYPAQLSQNL
ncbi:hypothetical protein MMC13_001599 [Lambiella insularis]|nr:hypothetical protein [Lambiella insularis]